MSDDGDRETALAVKAPPLARDLASARAGQLLHVDRHGQVRSPARLHAIRAAAYGVLLACSGVVVVGGAIAGGVLGGAVGGLFAAWVVRVVGQSRRVTRGTELLADGRDDEAEAVLTRVADGRLVPRRVRAMALHKLAVLAVRRGQHAVALERMRRAIDLYGRRGVYVRFLELAEIAQLVHLGRTAEARTLFDARHRTVPDGDLLRAEHWHLEHLLAMAEGSHAIDADELHRRARFALGLTIGAPLLVSLAWAHHHAGDTDQAWHLLREAFERERFDQSMRSQPILARWVDAHRAEALAAAPPSDD